MKSHFEKAFNLRQSQVVHVVPEAIANVNGDANGVADGEEEGQGENPVGQAEDPV